MALLKLNPVEVSAAYPAAEIQENIKLSLKRPYPRLHFLPEFGKNKKGKPIALVGGGPSLKYHFDELKEFDTVMVAGSPHDYVVLHGIVPKYTLLLDAHSQVTALYIQKPCVETTYLVATHCPESVFAVLEGYPIAMWHCIMESSKEFLEEVEPGFQGLGGGCTSGMRAIGMAMVLGYRNLHLFGYDSCLPDTGESHAYPLQDEEVEKEGIASHKIYNIKFGLEGPESKSYSCLGYQLAQAQNFEQMVVHHHQHFDLTFHGGGLLYDIYDTMMCNKDKIAEIQEVISGVRTSTPV